MSDSVNIRSFNKCGSDLLYHSFEEWVAEELETTLNDLKALSNRYVAKERAWSPGEQGMQVSRQNIALELATTSLHDLHDIMLGKIRTCIEKRFDTSRHLSRVSQELTKIILECSNRLLDRYRVAIFSMLTSNADTFSAAFMDESIKLYKNIETNNESSHSLVKACMQHPQMIKSMMYKGIQQFWDSENKGLEDVQKRMEVFHQKCKDISTKVSDMKKNCRSKDEYTHDLIMNLRTLKEQMMLQESKEAGYKENYLVKECQTSGLSEKSSLLMERHNKGSVELAKQTKRQENQVSEILKYKIEAFGVLLFRLERSINLISQRSSHIFGDN